MSIHPSLRGVDTLKGERSVLTRFERIKKLERDGALDPEEASAFGLPKVRTKFKVSRGKKKAATEAAGAGEAAEAEGGEAAASAPSADRE